MCYYKQFRTFCPCGLELRCAARSPSTQIAFIPSAQRTLHLVHRPRSSDRACEFWRASGVAAGLGDGVRASRWCPYSPARGRFDEVVDSVMPQVCGLCSERCGTEGRE
ncbi:hypothetical protein E4U41_006305 [Claviceps citrina]|nr:hypothetical protein E4U41_006305 [Claviceps citrina]